MNEWGTWYRVEPDPHNAAQLDCELRGVKARKVSGRVLTAKAMNAHNTFDQPNAVHPEVFEAVELSDQALKATLPAKSVVVLEIEL
ncbi:hypothetical protein MYX78_05010 [Acidobacteria bacterium AH-259-G07]|nr:hypothetical protein [Acidobacteria bacterium AH-259-G07]